MAAGFSPRTTPGAWWRACGSPPASSACSSAARPAFHAQQFFLDQVTIFGLIFMLETAPMSTFIRVRAARRRGGALPQFPIETFRRINAAELALVIVIVFVAAFMARGAWLF
jgi:uncharacterized membrane protein